LVDLSFENNEISLFLYRTTQQKQNTHFRVFLPVLGKNEMEVVRILIIFQDRRMFSHEKLLSWFSPFIT